jgi:hypothetical protein
LTCTQCEDGFYASLDTSTCKTCAP